MSRARTIAGLCLLGVGWTLGGCASLDSVAVAETHRLENAPYYVALATPQPEPGSCAIVFPVSLDPELVHQFGYADRLREFEPLLEALDTRLASLPGCVKAVSQAPSASRPPRVYVGSAEGEYVPLDAGDQRVPGDRFAPMILHLERPGGDWRSQAAAIIAQSGVQYAVAVQLGVSQYAKGYSGAFSKEVVLGTGYRQPIRFLTAEDKPVEVLHLTGVLVDANGKPVRAGAEGIVLRDTPFLAQAVGVTRTFDSDELRRVLNQERRADLAGAPFKLDVALDNLVAQLTRN
jgi:hypothetical protein